MLGRAAQRFLRTSWASPQELAEELYAIFSPLQAIEASKIIINQQAGDESPPLTINRGGDAAGPSLVVNRGGGSSTFGDITIHGGNYGGTTFDFQPGYGLPDRGGATLEIGDFPPGGGIIGGAGGGGVDLSEIDFPYQESGSIPSASNTPFTLYGVVVGKESGSTYSVNVWAVAPTGPRAGTLSVRFPMVDPNEEIPAGTQIPVLCFPGESGGARRVVDAIGFIAVYME